MATVGPDIVMEDDMQVGSALLGPDDLKTLCELSAYRVDRQKAALWAHRDIKFLVYDDTSLQQNGYDSDDEEGMVEYAMMISEGVAPEEGSPRLRSSPRLGGEAEEVGSAFVKIPRDEENEGSSQDEENEGSSQDEEELYYEPKHCEFCLSMPEFPHSWKPRKFRLVRPEQVTDPQSDSQMGSRVCCHYAAVSYCWPVPEKDEHGEPIMIPSTYQVRDLDGTVRLSRAQDNVLDRAVEFARLAGMRMIWIDQECLPQPTESSPQEQKDEQQLGVQAMDIVYNRAIVTAGLISTKITSQEQILAVSTLLSFELDEFKGEARWEGSGPAPSLPDLAQLVQHAVDLLDIVNADRWYTRAWVSQEALVAGEMLVLVLPLGPGISFETSFEFVGIHEIPLLTAIEELPAGAHSRIFVIPVKDFQRFVRTTRYLFQNSSTHRDAGLILATAEALHPTAPQPACLSERMFIPGGNNYRPRPTVDAAGALTILRTRGCRDVQDRVALVANMCNFENRLDTSILARRCKSLRLALIALTVLNGDYSLLVPEAYALGVGSEYISPPPFPPDFLRRAWHECVK